MTSMFVHNPMSMMTCHTCGKNSWTEQEHIGHRCWPDPTAEHLSDPRFDFIWECIKSWDINVPGVYEGYMAATGNHVRAILDVLDLQQNLQDRQG